MSLSPLIPIVLFVGGIALMIKLTNIGIRNLVEDRPEERPKAEKK